MTEHSVTEQLARIWADVLHVDLPGPDDDFFELGGDSLLATKVVLHARRIWNADLTVRVLLDHPILRDLTMRVEELRPPTHSEPPECGT
ncbi:MAG TPA: phosphopantetheine-binding protein [Actinoplanes sp.]|nr:phosphopantetheine-binding protein [Actinoplanes sp.]